MATALKSAATATRPARASQKKRFGKYYTPQAVSDILSEWGIREINDRVLEPSFGGCGFLASAQSRFMKLGSNSPLQGIYGSDLDPNAFAILRRTLPTGKYSSHFIRSDFLALEPNRFDGRTFNLIFGNPPYVSRHNMSKAQRKRIADLSGKQKYTVSATASLWAYFVEHGLRFLAPGGRIAWVLPGSVIHADYAVILRKTLEQSFARIALITLKERLFHHAGTDENTIILLATDFKTGDLPGAIQPLFANSVDSLRTVISRWEKRKYAPPSTSTRKSLSSNLTIKQNDTLAALGEFAKPLGDCCKIRIGIVTGNNRFFIKSESEREECGIPNGAVVHTVSKSSMIQGLRVKTTDLKRFQRLGLKCLLVGGTNTPKHLKIRLKPYFATYPKQSLQANSTFKKREDWTEIDNSNLPDAFVRYMNQDGPLLALNSAATNCTNTLYQIFFKSGTTLLAQKLIAISLASSYSQARAEIEGRRYGGGLLKHEPSELARIGLLLPDHLEAKTIQRTFDLVDSALREGDEDKARLLADALVLAPVCEQSGRDITEIQAILLKLRSQRVGRAKRPT